MSRSVAHTAKEIFLLREFRTSLIADVVTGKLDVREAAAKLPTEEADPKELIEEDADLENDLDLDDSLEDAAA